MKNFIVLTSSTEHLAGNLKKKLRNFEFIIPDKNKDGKRLFPDGEIYMRISEVNNFKGARIIVLHSGSPYPNCGLIELELILQILKDYKIMPEVFFTYFSYGQQDKIFENGETNAAENLVKKLINYYKVKKIYIIDPHFGKMDWVKKYPIINVSAVPFLVQRVKENFGKDILFLSPDEGGKRRTGIFGLKKKRINSHKVEVISSGIHVKGKTVAVIDDLLETGGTLLRFYDFAKESGAKKIIALITHGVLEKGIKRVKNSFSEFYFTNTIKQKEANVDVVGLIADCINKF